MFKKVAAGTLVTGLLFSGFSSNTFAAEASTTVNNSSNDEVNESLEQASDASVNIEINGKYVEFYAEDLANKFTDRYYSEIVFSTQDPNGRAYLNTIDRDQKIISVDPEDNEASGYTAMVSQRKTKILDKIYKIYDNQGYSLPKYVNVYAYAKPANDNRYWVIQPYRLNTDDLY
ncbi:hypothetical protein PVA17_22665 [Lysinibacillus sp. CNPSo 3705]|uniref:hypothetical protein n=1 Tax=Lysinibacillus sp. CNPSo 3705 TaxID=3028148 RepID=UPI00236388BB|nr:hypothetical protein [Lysinibacillus sp. CNPSo 3705]MDD1505526.1 hypothetical protein [Lysinibacillus sp. CNPSo 3705]